MPEPPAQSAESRDGDSQDAEFQDAEFQDAESRDAEFQEAVQGLMRGDFTRLDPLFDGGDGSRILAWHARGLFDGHPEALAEALSCACFNGRTHVARVLMDHGVDPAAGNATGMNAFHWAADRGHLDTVGLLIERKAPLEARNRFGGTVLGGAVWSYMHEPRPKHIPIIHALLHAGANRNAVSYPTGNELIDEVFHRHGAKDHSGAAA